MGAYITYSDTLPRYFDSQKITADKILQALNNGAGGGGGVGGGTLSGSGAPSSGTGSNGDVYVDTTNTDLYIKTGGSWKLAVDVV